MEQLFALTLDLLFTDGTIVCIETADIDETGTDSSVFIKLLTTDTTQQVRETDWVSKDIIKYRTRF